VVLSLQPLVIVRYLPQERDYPVWQAHPSHQMQHWLDEANMDLPRLAKEYYSFQAEKASLAGRDRRSVEADLLQDMFEGVDDFVHSVHSSVERTTPITDPPVKEIEWPSRFDSSLEISLAEPDLLLGDVTRERT
jgi:glutaredoxin 2